MCRLYVRLFILFASWAETIISVFPLISLAPSHLLTYSLWSWFAAEMDSEQIALQETKYEIISSESSYYKSLLILETVFIMSEEMTDTAVLRTEDHTTLFSGIIKGG